MAKKIIEILFIIFLAWVFSLPVRFFLFQPFLVSGSSMEPNFFSGEYLLINVLKYKISDPQRGDVVVFKTDKRGVFLIKRVIGLPGETVEIKDGKVIIYNSENPKGFVLKENYLKESFTPGEMKITLKKDEYFVLGDNRRYSYDSRSFGPIKRKDILGKAWISLSLKKGLALEKNPSY